MAVQNSFPKSAILDIRDASKVNYFAADKGKSLICGVFIKAGMVLFCVYVKFYNLFSNDFLHSCLIQFFFVKVFQSKMQIRCISNFSSSSNHGAQNLRSVLRLFSLGKLTNHFLKVKSNPEHILCTIFQEKSFSCYVLLTDQISLSDCLYFLRYQAICVFELFASQVVTS